MQRNTTRRNASPHDTTHRHTTQPDVTQGNPTQLTTILHHHTSGTIVAKRRKDCDRDYDVDLKYSLKGSSEVFLQDFKI
jgi:hypothetical protein